MSLDDTTEQLAAQVKKRSEDALGKQRFNFTLAGLLVGTFGLPLGVQTMAYIDNGTLLSLKDYLQIASTGFIGGGSLGYGYHYVATKCGQIYDRIRHKRRKRT